MIYLYSPGAQQNYGHANALIRGFAPALSRLAPVTLVTHSGPAAVEIPGVTVLQPSGKRGATFSIPTRYQRNLQRFITEPRLIQPLFEGLSRNPTAPVFFETFEHHALARMIRTVKPFKYSTFFHSGDFSLGNRGLVRKVYKSSARHSARTIAMGAHTNYVFSDGIGALLRQTLDLPVSTNVRTIVHPSSPSLGETTVEMSRRAKAELGLQINRPTLTLFGTLHKERNYLAAIRAVAAAERWQLLIAGNERDITYHEIEKSIQEFNIADRTTLIPRYIRSEEHAHVMQATDLLALLYPPEMTHTSGTLNFSRSFGVPSIFTGPPDIERYVRENRVGFVPQSQGWQHVTEVLRQYNGLSEPDKILLRRNVLSAADKFSWNSFAERLLIDWAQVDGRT